MNLEFFRQASLLNPNLGKDWVTLYAPIFSGLLFGIVLKYLDVVLPDDS
jgi:hypothetical protein